MLTITRLTAQGTNRDGANILAYLKATEYYRDKDGNVQSASQWVGNGSKALGLEGTADEETMDKLAFGFGPDGEPLKQNAGQGSRVGWDMTFSPVKDYSVLYAASDEAERDRLLAAHHEAVNSALGYLEDLAAVRTGHQGMGPRLRTSGLVASRHTHFASRELDPQIHSHCLVYNIAQGEDGVWRALDTNDIGNHVRAAGALYRNQLAANLQDLGYGIRKERETDAEGRDLHNITFRIQGVDPELSDEFSKRRKQILEYQEEHEVGAQLACLATRADKDEPPYEELTELWRETLDRLEQTKGIRLDPEAIKGMASEVDEPTDADITRWLHATEATFTRADLVERIALEQVGRQDLDEVLKEVERVRERVGMVETGDPQERFRKFGPAQQTFTTPEMLAKEQEIRTSGIERQCDYRVRVPVEHLKQAIEDYESERGFTLTEEQRQGVAHITTDTGGLAILSGRAGTGKTTVSEVAVAAWQADGREVLGTSTSWKAAKNLESEAKIPSISTEQLLTELNTGRRTLKEGSIVLFDEAGMAGTLAIHGLQQHVDRAGAKLVLLGDAQQLQPIAAGNPFAAMTDTIGHSELTEIRRQKSEADRATANAHYSAEEGAELMGRLEERNQLEVVTNTREAIKAIAVHYMASEAPESERLVLAGTRAEVRGLNEEIRRQRMDAGVMDHFSYQVTTINGGREEEISIARGERIVFGKLDKDLGVYNGLNGTVEEVLPDDEKNLRIRVRTESDIPANDGLIVEFTTDEFCHFTHAYAMTIHKSQGQGKKDVFHLANASMTDRHLQLVAFTRSKENYRMFALEDDLDDLRERVATDRQKVNAVDWTPPAEEQKRFQTQPEPVRIQRPAVVVENYRKPDPPERDFGLSM